jgi:RNase H-fold protein (predicted Holliday junction resolvase)
MKILGIDYGQKRIGLAMAQGTMAFPFKTLEKSTRDSCLPISWPSSRAKACRPLSWDCLWT